MLFLNCPSKLATLRRLLVHNFPESLKACGALQHVINGNPFNLQVLVDQWPDFSTVLCRPALEDMKDPMDHYTNTYFLFSKDLHNLRQLLQDPQAVNWSQNLQIQGCQPALGGVLQEISLKYGTQLQTTSNFLYMKDRVTDDDIQERNSNISGNCTPRYTGREKRVLYTQNIADMAAAEFSSLVPEEADIVNAVWAFGGDKNGERYVRRCIQSFPSVCLRKEGTPIAWTMSEQSAEMRMGYTDKQYRNKGIFRTLIRKLTSKMDSLGTPHYCHVAPDNKSSHTATVAAGYPKGLLASRMRGRGWNESSAQQAKEGKVTQCWDTSHFLLQTELTLHFVHTPTWHRMILLSCPYKLAFLRKLLRCSFPESLKVHGALHYVINKNPFRLEVLVDQWPDFTSVICRPLMEEMKDPSDPHTNTYFVFSTNQHNLSHMLQDPQVVNWNHSFQLQGCQPELQDVLHIISSKQGSHIQTVSNVLYMRHGKRCANELAGLHSTSEFQFSPLRPDEAQLVNAQWGFGGNERSENYIKRCIQNFPTVCARKPGLQQPISWVLSEQSAEMRMGYTERAYRSHRLFGNVATKLISTLESAEVPMYCHVAADNINSHRACMAVGYSPVGKWQQWKFQPH